MSRPVSKTPSEVELEVLQVIWREGPSTLRQIHEALPAELTRASVFNRLESLVNKGLVTLDPRSKGEGGGVYLAVQSRENMMGRMFRQLTRLLGGGSSKALFQGLLKAGELNERELKELRALLDRRTGKGKKS